MNTEDFENYDWDRIQCLGFSEDTANALKGSYGKGLSKEEKGKAKNTIEKTMAKAEEGNVSAKELYKDWPSDKSYNKRLKDSGKKMPESPSTKAYKDMYGDHAEWEEFAEKNGLPEKSKKSGISLGTLKKVYERGMAAWRSGHRPGTSPQQWAMARVNSFITGKGGARKADADLTSKKKGKSK